MLMAYIYKSLTIMIKAVNYCAATTNAFRQIQAETLNCCSTLLVDLLKTKRNFFSEGNDNARD